jgi:serpin B
VSGHLSLETIRDYLVDVWDERMKQFFFTLIVAAVLLADCTGSPLVIQTDIPGTTSPDISTGLSEQFVQADVPRISSPELSSAQIDPLVRGLNGFAIDFYHQTQEQEIGNWMYSPYSISLAFSLAYAGARGETERQMAEVLHFLPQEAHHPAFNALDQRLAGLDEEEPKEEDAFQLKIANAVWGQQGFPIQPDYLETLARHYGAGLRAVDFTRDPNLARKMINDWVAEKTEDRLQDVVPDGFITIQTRLVLANAIYFKAAWVYPFDPSATQDGPFTLTDGTQVTVPLMHVDPARVPYIEGDGYQAALLPYKGLKADMIVVVPEPGRFEDIEEQLSLDFLNEIRQGAVEHDVNLSMPKLDFETALDLREMLTGMGMLDAFNSGSADFSGIASELFISHALHKSMITVDEKGTEAAATTVIAMEESAYPRAELTIDRPFIFAIVERESGAVLFLGRVVNPAQH